MNSLAVIRDILTALVAQHFQGRFSYITASTYDKYLAVVDECSHCQ